MSRAVSGVLVTLLCGRGMLFLLGDAPTGECEPQRAGGGEAGHPLRGRPGLDGQRQPTFDVTDAAAKLPEIATGPSTDASIDMSKIAVPNQYWPVFDVDGYR